MSLLVKTNVVTLARQLGKKKQPAVASIAGDFLPALELKVGKLIEDAIERSRANGRKTAMGKDI